jgi:GT2 family glycosyltransferase
MIVRKSAIDKIGLLDEDIFMFGEDIDWCWRLKQIGLRVTYVPSSIIYHYHGAASRLRPVGAAINLHKGMEVFYRKHLAPQHTMLFNALVYTAIWLRALVYMILSLVQSSIPREQGVFADSAVMDFSPPEEDFDRQWQDSPDLASAISPEKTAQR